MAVDHYHHHDTTTGPAASDSSAMTVIVALIAVLFIIGLGIFALRTSGYNMGGAGTVDRINVDVNTPPAVTPGGGDAPANP